MSISMDTNQLAQQIKDVTLDAVSAVKEAVVGSEATSTPVVDDKHRVFIGNLNFDTTEDELRTLFSQAGEIITLPTKRNYRTKSTQPSGIAFVGYENDAQAEKAVETLNGKTLGEREINVAIARPLSERKPKTKSTKSQTKTEETSDNNKVTDNVDGSDLVTGEGEKKKRVRKPRADKKTDSTAETADASVSDKPNGTATKTRAPREKGPPADGVPSTTTLFVAGLDPKVTDEGLEEIFAKYKPVSAHVALRLLPRFMMKRLAEKGEQRLNRRFGFVTFADEASQLAALKGMDGQKVGENELAVKVAMDRKTDTPATETVQDTSA